MQDTDDIDALIDELHASTGAAAARPGSSLGIEALLATVVERRGSDLHQEITITRKQGSLTLEDSLARLVRDGVVTRAEALMRAGHPDEFESALRAAAQS